ncbi:putative DNA-binding protein [Jeotgalibaca sp. MA1X17-3]|uniref:putative DNA-binding protein n=1 Tax=Jeotgalibaca sp. MA1X17-3 TaxID=2908211 RepID=UPI001F1AA9DC|nr:putative DNA-binding protein [Jeotgalibaca sp. MA1X17-3]UJF14926.1 putative DNA-binding protein [Jeotgalibaca sp. MA1X17-3]
MELEKTNDMNTLFEFYNILLTKKQRGYLSLYYGDDYSLGEIADEFGVSRQAIYDNIKRTEKILLDYEEKLQMAKNFRLRQDILDQIKEYVSEEYPDDQKLLEMILKVEKYDE